MSKLIAQLLQVDRRTLETQISRLEHMTLQPGVDARLTAEIITQVREKSRRLGMDPADTTAEELFYGLQAKAEADDVKLKEILKITDGTKPHIAAERIALKAESLLARDTVLAMQPAAVKKILKAVPPKKTLRILKFRSIDAVLKRENPLVLYALAKRLEDKTWEKQIYARLKRLTTRDVGEHPIHVVSLPAEWLEKLEKISFSSVIHPVAEIGSIIILPTMPLRVKGSVLLTTTIVLQAAQKMLCESLPFKLKTMSVGIETLLPDIAAGNLDELQPIHGMSLSWHTVYRAVATQSKHRISEVEFMMNDLFWENTETRLAMISPELDYWVNTHYLGFVHDEKAVSLHVMDIAASLVLERTFGDQVNSHLKMSLWNELQTRYLAHESLENALIPQLTMAQEFMV